MLYDQYDKKRFCELFREIRLKNNFSLKKLSDLSGISINTIRKLEHGKLTCRIETLFILSFYLETDLIEMLSDLKNPIHEELFRIRYKLDVDLSKRNYVNLATYLDELKSFYNRVRYDDNNWSSNDLFNLIDKMIDWILGIESSIKNNHIRAEKYFLTAISIDNNNFEIDNIHTYYLAGIDLNILNSFVTNRLAAENYDNIDYYIMHLCNMLLSSSSCHQAVYIRLCFNTSTLHVKRSQYIKAIDLVNKTIRYMNNDKLHTEYASLLFIKALSRYNLGIISELDEIRHAIDAFIYEGKKKLIPIIFDTLDDKNFHFFNLLLFY